MRNCKKITQLISESNERPLLVSEKLDLKMHLMMCSGCNNFNKNVSTINQAMKHFASGKYEKHEALDDDQITD
jgi:hypothetical protein